MKKALNVTFGAVMAAGLAVPAFADFEHDLITHSAFSASGTYTQTSNNGVSMGDYATVDSITQQQGLFTSANVSNRAIFIDADAQPDFALGYTYHIPCSNTHFFVTYDHFRSHDENYATGPVVNIEVGPFVQLGFDDIIVRPTQGFARLEQHSDEWRIGFSHLLGFGNRFHLDVNGYFEWDKVSRSLFERMDGIINTSFGSELPIFAPDSASRITDGRLQGWGPGAGAMAMIKPLPNDLHWGLFMGAKTTLLWVNNKFSQRLVHTPIVQNFGPADYVLDPEDSDSVVTKLDITFGIDYCTIFHPPAGRILFETALGMRYMNIFNAFKNGNAFFNPFWPANSSFAANTGYPNDWGRIGPFLTFRVGGAEA